MAELKRTAVRVFGRLPAPGRRFLVRRFTPSYTVGTMCVVRRDDDAVLLLQHEYRGAWGLPGGLLRRSEGAEDGARRETREETGLDIEIVGAPTVVVEPRDRRVDVVFHCRSSDAGSVATTGTAEVHAARWFPLDDLPELQEHAAAGLRRLADADPVIREALGPEPEPTG